MFNKTSVHTVLALLFVATSLYVPHAQAQVGTTTDTPAVSAPLEHNASLSDGSISFFNFETNQYQTTFPWNTNNEIVVSGKDVSSFVPLTINFTIDNAVAWEGEIPNQQSCKDNDTCSTRGPVLADPGTVPIEIVALSLQSSQPIRITYREGNSGTSSTATTPTLIAEPTSTEVSAPVYLPLPLNQKWFNGWWMVGLIVGSLWMLLWLFIGLQWWRLHFWNFGWPGPWWFWIPWFWFIPWLVVGWVWWLEWDLWWAWLWWIFPWIFWMFWWLILFKEATIWAWRRRIGKDDKTQTR